MKHASRIKRITRALTVTVLTAALLCGCATYRSFKHTFVDEKTRNEGEVIYIGVYEPTSGDLAEQGNDELKGIRLANKIYSNVNGKRVELIVVDNQSRTGSAKTAIQDLIEMKPVLIIGSAGESLSMVASPYIKEAKIPMITPSSTNPLITQSNPYYFRACITDTQRGQGLAEYAYSELGSDKIGIITIRNDSTSSMLTDGFMNKLDELSQDDEDPIVLRTVINLDDYELTGVVDRISESGASVVFMPVGLEKADVIFTQIEEANLTGIIFLGEPNWAGSDFAAMMEKHPNIRVAFPSDYVAAETSTTENSVTDETERFQIEYANMYGVNDIPSENTALGYDSYLLAINAISRADSTDPQAGIRNLQCTTGVFSFDDFGNPVREVNISTHRNGEIVLLYSSNSTTAEEMETIDSEIVEVTSE